jgi:adenylylsulfate kinase
MKAENQPGVAIWLTGLPSSGKSTLAQSLHKLLEEKGVTVQILDSDNVRKVLTPAPTYSEEERDWFYRVLAYIAGLLTENGVNVIIAATAPKREHRQAARERIHLFVEVYLNCPEEVCRERDSKGLWKRAEAG